MSMCPILWTLYPWLPPESISHASYGFAAAPIQQPMQPNPSDPPYPAPHHKEPLSHSSKTPAENSSIRKHGCIRVIRFAALNLLCPPSWAILKHRKTRPRRADRNPPLCLFPNLIPRHASPPSNHLRPSLLPTTAISAQKRGPQAPGSASSKLCELPTCFCTAGAGASSSSTWAASLGSTRGASNSALGSVFAAPSKTPLRFWFY